jgi:hypothetical protein
MKTHRGRRDYGHRDLPAMTVSAYAWAEANPAEYQGFLSRRGMPRDADATGDIGATVVFATVVVPRQSLGSSNNRRGNVSGKYTLYEWEMR